LVAGVGFGVYFWMKSKPVAVAGPTPVGAPRTPGVETAWSDADASVPVTSRDPMWGERDASVTIVVFEDFQCPFCARYRTTLASVKEKYGPEKVRVIWKNNPLAFHKDARPAAIAGETIFRLGGSKAFWSFHDAAFASQSDLNGDSFERWARDAGVDVAQFRALRSSPEVAAKVDADAAGAKAAGAKGTPATFINGFLVEGAQPLERVVALVDGELAAAERARAAGTPADRVYVKLSSENKLKNPPAPAPKPSDDDDTKVWEVPVGDSPSRGPASAKVTVVVFSDFQCPFCARAVATIEQVRETYGDKVRIVWKNNPLAFHKQAAPAAELAIEAHEQKGNAGFWAAHDLLFKNQKALSDEDLEGYAATLKLDVVRARKAIAQQKHKSVIEADQALARKLSASGTPTFFINGRRLTGAQPFEKFKAAIDRELERR
jgi:protein-disulfide isomerase